MNFKKITTSLITLAIMFSLCSCEESECEKGVVGGLCSQVRWIYQFESYEDYSEFYDIFKDYNEERYWVPSSDSNYFEVAYDFYTCPIRLKDALDRRYDLEFSGQELSTTLVNDEIEIELTFNSLDIVNFVNMISLETYVTAVDDTYEISIIHNNEIVIAYGIIEPVVAIEDESFFYNYLIEIIKLFNISAIDVFM